MVSLLFLFKELVGIDCRRDLCYLQNLRKAKQSPKFFAYVLKDKDVSISISYNELMGNPKLLRNLNETVA